MYKIHHLTHIDNLESIFKNGLVSRSKLEREKKKFTDTAETDIIEKRGSLNNLIPFHFSFIQEEWGIPYNYSVCKKVESENVVFFEVEVKYSQVPQIKFILQHPVSNNPSCFDDYEEFKLSFDNEIRKYTDFSGFINYANQEVKKLFMSEIIFDFNDLKINERWKIYVYSDKVKERVEKILDNYFNEYTRPKVYVDTSKLYFRNL